MDYPEQSMAWGTHDGQVALICASGHCINLIEHGERYLAIGHGDHQHIVCATCGKWFEEKINGASAPSPPRTLNLAELRAARLSGKWDQDIAAAKVGYIEE